MAVAGNGRLVAQGVELGRQFGLGGDQLPIFFAHRRVRFDVNPALIAIHDNGAALVAADRPVAQTHDRRDADRPGQNGDMGQRRTAQTDQTGQSFRWYRRQVGHAHFLGHQHAALGDGFGLPVGTRPQMMQHPSAQVADILGAGAKVGVFGPFQQPDPGQHRVAPGGRCPAAGLEDAGQGVADQAVAA